jgi:prepilin-type N-terminal cleavage/methylation domain-containing protein
VIKRKGFTLVELIIVICIVCVLGSVLVGLIGKLTNKQTYNSIPPSHSFGPPSSQPSIVAGPSFEIRHR